MWVQSIYTSKYLFIFLLVLNKKIILKLLFSNFLSFSYTPGYWKTAFNFPSSSLLLKFKVYIAMDFVLIIMKGKYTEENLHCVLGKWVYGSCRHSAMWEKSSSNWTWDWLASFLCFFGFFWYYMCTMNNTFVESSNCAKIAIFFSLSFPP